MKNAQIVLFIVTGIVVSCIALYGMYWVFKTISYSIFYEDMVKNTIVEMVKKDSLSEELK